MRPLALIILLALPAYGQKNAPPPDAMRATVLKVADVYVAPDAESQKVSVVTPGHEVLIVQRSGPWVKVFANTDVEEEKAEEEPEFSVDAAVLPRSGWIRDKGVVGPATPNGDKPDLWRGRQHGSRGRRAACAQVRCWRGAPAVPPRCRIFPCLAAGG